MRKEGVFSIARILGEKNPEVNRNGWVVFSCPFAPFRHDSGVDKNPSFAIKVENNGSSRYHCFSCSSSGDLIDLATELGVLYKGADRKPDIKTLMDLAAREDEEIILSEHDIPDFEVVKKPPVVDYDFPEWWLDNFPSAFESPLAMKYLRDVRGVPDSVIRDLDLRWDGYRSRVGFPFRNREGLLCGMNGRIIKSGDSIPYYQYSFDGHYNLHLWYGEDTMDLDRTLVVTESVFDRASIHRVYQNCLAGFSCSFSKEKALRLGDAAQIITLFDAGKGGDIARDRMRKYLGDLVIADIVPEEDAGEMTIAELEEALGDLVPLKYIDKQNYEGTVPDVPWY